MISLLNTSTSQLTHACYPPSYAKTEGNSISARSHTWCLLFFFTAYTALRQHNHLLPEYLHIRDLFTPQAVLALMNLLCNSTYAQFVMHLSEHHIVSVVGLGSDELLHRHRFDLPSHN